MSESDLKRTSLYDAHKKAGAKMVPFAGWEMPVQYEGVIQEHKNVRTNAGVFDVSHMGEFTVTGKDSTAWLNRLLTNDVASVQLGQAQYNLMLYDNGGVVDDLIVYRRKGDEWLVVVNASNIEKDFDWMRRHYGFGGLSEVKIADESMKWALIAVQGPNAAAILQKLTDARLDLVPTYRFAEGKIAGVQGILARTGYTGEDGFEVAVPWNDATTIWDAVIAGGAKPAGLAARDTLRLEMKDALYGNDIDQTTNPLEAGLGWVVKLAKGVDFVGKAALERIKGEGVKRKLIGFEMKDRGIPRAGYPLIDPATKAVIGKTTSGTQSPSLDRPIGVGYVDSAFSAAGKEIAVEIRGEPRKAVVVQTPFYKKAK